jgi:acetyl-CoA acetyltransferase
MNRWLIARDDREFPHNSRCLLREGQLARVNVNGGAIALGRPVGMSGARLVLTLALELRRRGGGTGAAALCGGGGQGDALILRAR